MTRVELSFDDSLVEQYRWARLLGELHVPATFYVSPGLLRPGRLQEWMLPEMKGWGHTIGNHTWMHEHPAQCGVARTLESINDAADWLDDKGFDGSLLAVPKGVRGGGWSDELLEKLEAQGYAIRDVRWKRDEVRPLPGAWESTELPFVEPTDLRYFHGIHRTPNDAFCAFACEVARLRDAGELEVRAL